MYEINENILTTEFENESVLLNVDTGLYYGLDEVSSDIWLIIKEGGSTTQVFDFLLSTYNCEEQEVWNDIQRILNQFESLGFLKKKDTKQ